MAYVNDSKATNVASTLVALATYPSGVHLIAGGRNKRQDFSLLAPLVAERCQAVYLIGEAAGELEQALRPTRIPLHELGAMDPAVAAARAAAAPGDAVPALAGLHEF